MNVYDKIKEARMSLGQTQTMFAKEIGVTQKDVSKLEKGDKKFIPNEYIDYLISKGFDINTLFNSNLDLGKVEEMKVSEPSEVYKLRTDKSLQLQSIPLYNMQAIAGITPIFSDLNSQEPIDFLHIPNAPKSDGALHASGDSMYPLIKSGDIICYKTITDIKNDIFWGQIYLIDLSLSSDDLLTTKYIKKGKDDNHVLLVSANKHHEDKEIHISKIRGLAHVKTIVRFP